LLEQRFGHWAAPAVAKGVKDFTALAPRPTSPRILLVNRPGSPQSTILGAELLPLDPKGDIVPFDTANEVLGGTFLSRLNMDLRETNRCSYRLTGDPPVLAHAVPHAATPPAHPPRTGPPPPDLNPQHPAARVEHRAVHLPVAVLEDPQGGDLVGEPGSRFETVVPVDADQDQQARPDLAGHLPLDHHPCRGDAGDHRSHRWPLPCPLP